MLKRFLGLPMVRPLLLCGLLLALIQIQDAYLHIDGTPYFILWVFGDIAIVALILTWIERRADNKRRTRFKAVAKRNGYEFVKKKESLFKLVGEAFLNKKRERTFYVFNQGGTNLDPPYHLTVKRGEVDLVLFDFEYDLSTAGDQHPEDNISTMCVIRSPRLNLPQFTLRPENLWQKVFNRDDIDFSDHPAFSSRFLLTGLEGEDEKVRAVFNAGLLRHLEKKKGICIEGYRDTFLYYRLDKIIMTDQFPAMIDESLQLEQLFPSKT
jgi:hypothetical protein